MSTFSNTNSNPLPSHNFFVFIGPEKIPFSKVSSIDISVDTEVLMEGGENRYVHSLSKPASEEKMLVFERGVDSFSSLGSVLLSIASTILSVGSFFNMIIIAVMDQQSLPKKVYVATDTILKKRSFSTLNAMSGEVFVETMEFSYKELTEVPGVNALFSFVGAALPNSSTKPERFTKPLDPKPEPKPKPEPFTAPLG